MKNKSKFVRKIKDIIMPEYIKPVPVLVVEVGEKRFYATFEHNSSAEALIEKFDPCPITLEMHDYGHFEKVASLPWELPRNDMHFKAVPGDIVLYGNNQITIYYDENTWDFTRIAKIGNVTKDKLLSALGEGDVSIKLYLEWSE